MTAIRVLIVDDHCLVGEALTRLLADLPGLAVVGCARTGPEALALTKALQPSIVLMDIGLPGMDGVETTWTLRRQFPAIPVLILTMYDQEAYALEGLRAGASGYLLKTATPEQLLAAIRAVCAGQPVIDGRLAGVAVERLVRRRRLPPDPLALSRREVQILQLIVAGYGVDGVSRYLVLSPHTVRNHLKAIYRKLGVHGRAEAAVAAVRQGLAKA